MPITDDVLKPIPGEIPSGRDLRYEPVYEQIKEARRQDDNLAKGIWAERERKVADYALVKKLTQQAIATQSKDLQLAAWLTEALIKEEGFAGLERGLSLCGGLIEDFWDTLYPALEDDDSELRAAPLNWIGSKLETTVKDVPINADGHSWYKFNESRLVPSESEAQTDATKKAREKLLKEGKLAPEIFDKGVAQTSKKFYADTNRELAECLNALQSLDVLCRKKFGENGPSFGQLKEGLGQIRFTVERFLEKKREAEPDPVEEPVQPEPAAVSEVQEPGVQATPGSALQSAAPAPSLLATVRFAAEPSDRRDAIAAIAASAAYLRKREPYSPAPYLMMRGLRWGELRAGAAAGDPTILEAPPTEIRQQIKHLALNRAWKELLETAETNMSLPCSRAWFDLQRFVVEACVALGPDYNAIAVAIRSELRALLRDLPELLDAKLMDDTAVANSETQVWLRGLMEEPEQASPRVHSSAAPVMDNHRPGWQKNFIDSYDLATEALRAGQEQKAFEILFQEIERQRSGRGRFQRRLQLVDLCISANKDAIAQPLLDDITNAIETHKLEEWEDRAMIAGALAKILHSSKRIQGDAKEKQKLFERICRLDPVQALVC